MSTVTRKQAVVSSVIVALVLVAASPSVARRKHSEPLFLDESFSSKDVGEVVVLAIADARRDKSIELKKLNEIGRRSVTRMLKKSPYKISFASGLGDVDVVTGDDLEYLEPSWIRRLGGADDRWILLLVLQDLAKKKTFGSAFGAVCSGYLFDKSTGKAVWHHETVGTIGQGGLVGFAMNNMMRGGSFESCANNLLATFPDRRRKKKKRS